MDLEIHALSGSFDIFILCMRILNLRIPIIGVSGLQIIVFFIVTRIILWALFSIFGADGGIGGGGGGQKQAKQPKKEKSK